MRQIRELLGHGSRWDTQRFLADRGVCKTVPFESEGGVSSPRDKCRIMVPLFSMKPYRVRRDHPSLTGSSEGEFDALRLIRSATGPIESIYSQRSSCDSTASIRQDCIWRKL